MVKLEEEVNSSWAQVENVYQRRADLIPNLVSTVKGYAAHESETLQAVIDARARATQPTAGTTPDGIAQVQAAQGALSDALSRLMVVVERYPDLKANENFKELQSQLEGSENRITTERQRFNETARRYNSTIRQFPKNILASLFNFEEKGYFQAMEGAESAPKVEF